MFERVSQGKGILNYFSHSERRRRRIEKLRNKLPTAVVAKCEEFSQGEVLLRALKFLDNINQKWGLLYNSETLVNAVLRESALGVPEVRDVVCVRSVTDHTDFRGNYYPSKDEIARQVNDRILIYKIDIENGYYDHSYVGSGGSSSYVVTETYEDAYYGYVVHKSSPRRGGRKQ